MNTTLVPLVERIVADVPEGVNECLTVIAERYNLSRADIIREAIHDLLNKLQVPAPEGLIAVVPILDEFVKAHGLPLAECSFDQFRRAYL